MKKIKNKALIEIGSMILGFALIIGNIVKDALDKKEQEEYIEELVDERIKMALVDEDPEEDEESEDESEEEEES